MSEPMTFQETGELLRHILQHHSPFTAKGGVRIVKYVDPHFDMRTGHCFAVKLRGYGWEKFFHTQNECRDLPESLLTRILHFLNTQQHENN